MFSSCVYTVVPQLTTPDSVLAFLLSVKLFHPPFNLFKDPFKNKSSNVSPFSQNVRKFEIIFETCLWLCNKPKSSCQWKWQRVKNEHAPYRTNERHINQSDVVISELPRRLTWHLLAPQTNWHNVCCLLPRKGCQLSECGEEIKSQQQQRDDVVFTCHKWNYGDFPFKFL